MTIKSKDRVRDHGEVFTPEFIVNDMLNLVKNETERIESRFLEPACGDGNFLIEVLKRKLNVVSKKYKKSQFDYEKNLILAISSIYGIELLEDNVKSARARLCSFCSNEYKNIYKDKINYEFLKNIEYVFSSNILQGNALDLKNNKGMFVTFSEWSLVNNSKIKRRDFQFVDLADFDINTPSLFYVREKSDAGKSTFSPLPVREFPAVSFMELYKSYE